jgi:cold shock CspA family protein
MRMMNSHNNTLLEMIVTVFMISSMLMMMGSIQLLQPSEAWMSSPTSSFHRSMSRPNIMTTNNKNDIQSTLRTRSGTTTTSTSTSLFGMFDWMDPSKNKNDDKTTNSNPLQDLFGVMFKPPSPTKTAPIETTPTAVVVVAEEDSPSKEEEKVQEDKSVSSTVVDATATEAVAVAVPVAVEETAVVVEEKILEEIEQPLTPVSSSTKEEEVVGVAVDEKKEEVVAVEEEKEEAVVVAVGEEKEEAIVLAVEEEKEEAVVVAVAVEEEKEEAVVVAVEEEKEEAVVVVAVEEKKEEAVAVEEKKKEAVVAEEEVEEEKSTTFPPREPPTDEKIDAYINDALKTNSRIQGVVQWYNGKTGFGFIRPFETSEEEKEIKDILACDPKGPQTRTKGIFVHHSAIQCPTTNDDNDEGQTFFRKLYMRETVDFDVNTDPRNGRPVATNVTGPNGINVKAILKQKSDKRKADQESAATKAGAE